MKRIAGLLTIAADPAYRSAEAAWRAGIEKMPQGRAGPLPQLGVQQSLDRNGVRIPGMSALGYSTVGFTVTPIQSIFKLDARETCQQGRRYASDASFALATVDAGSLQRAAVDPNGGR
ncbi:hypothetical protein [Burkholderia sp. PU8-34]